jgi:hypothetical protein
MIWLHVSELAIDRLLAGELAVADADAMRDHAQACKACGDRLAEARAVQHAWPALAPVLPIVRPRRHFYVAAMTAVAAALAVVLAWPHAEQTVATERTKGGAIAGFYVAHGGDIRLGGVDDTVVPGDHLQLFTTTQAPSWFALTSTDERGHTSVYIEPRVIEPGRERLLPLSLELDDALGRETLTAIFCAQRFEPQGDVRECSAQHFSLTKVAR